MNRLDIDPSSVSHLRMAGKEGLFPADLCVMQTHTPVESFCIGKFHRESVVIDRFPLAWFHNRIVSQVFRDFPATGSVHQMLYADRRNADIARMLYDKAGDPYNLKSSAAS